MEDKQKDYKYKLVEKKIHDIQRLVRDSGRQNYNVLCEGREGVFKPVLGLRKKDFKRTQISASHYGEFIAYKLAEKIGIPACKVELVLKSVKLKFSKSGKIVLVPGCISYFDLEKDETFTHAITILNWYKREHYEEYISILNNSGNIDLKLETNSDQNNNNIEIVIPALETYVKERYGATEQETAKIKQNIIDMVMYDCRFANTDRNDENYGLAYNIKNEQYRLYPLFDNEYILGFPEFEETITKYNSEGLREHINKNLTSRMGITGNPTKIDYQIMLEYLFTKYPEESKKSYDKVMKISELDLIELMNECEGLSETHKAYALILFRERRRGFEFKYEEYFYRKNQFSEMTIKEDDEISLDD